MILTKRNQLRIVESTNEPFSQATACAAKVFKGGAPDAEDMKEFQKVQKEMENDLAKILTPEELEDYQLRLSQTSMMMRMQLGSFDPNEKEFRDIFKLKKDLKWSDGKPITADDVVFTYNDVINNTDIPKVNTKLHFYGITP